MLAFGFLGMLVGPSGAWATRVYVTDVIKITVRTGPSTEHRIIAMLSTGEPVEILENQGDWSRVRVLTPKRKGLEGWVLSRYLMNRKPWEETAKSLEKEATALRERLEVLNRRLQEQTQRANELSERLRHNSRELERVREEFQSFKEGASNYIRLRQRFEEVKKSLEETQAELERLKRENESLKVGRNVKWFLTGALVLFGGWIIGVFTGRQGRRKKPSTYLYGR